MKSIVEKSICKTSWVKSIALLLVITSYHAQSATSFSSNVFITGKAKVYRVIDGDTYDLDVIDSNSYASLLLMAKSYPQGTLYFNDEYKSFRVRLAAIDTAESVHPDKNRNTERGHEISDYVKADLTSKTVKFICWKIGYYHRAVCSIDTNEGDYGLKLINLNFSSYYTKYGRHPYLDQEYRAAANRQ